MVLREQVDRAKRLKTHSCAGGTAKPKKKELLCTFTVCSQNVCTFYNV